MAALPTLDTDDFGYDFSPEDEEALIRLASADPAHATEPTPQAGTLIDAVPGKTDSAADNNTARHGKEHAYTRGRRAKGGPATRSKGSSGAGVDQGAQPPSLPSPVSPDEDVTYPDLSRALSNVETTQTAAACEPVQASEQDSFDGDGRSPLQKFRSYPRKPLTVSDLTSGAWCELQYEYTLTRLPGGRRTRTAAMRQGSKVHQKLEDEVHTTVKVDILTKEDGFGLRLWNLVQGLRTLRDTGLTRELEVWGMVDGNLVNGVIDSVSYENPNPEFEEELSSQESQQGPQQTKLADYFPPKKRDNGTRPRPKIYLTDVKTRGSLAPVSNSLLRPAKIQLMLYHRFLADMAAGRLDYFKVLRRYGLDIDNQFSDSFVAQIGSLHDEIFVDAFSRSAAEPSSSNLAHQSQDDSLSSNPEAPQAQGPDLLKYNSLRELLSLVKEEVALAFPEGEDSLGHMLRVQYIYRNDGRELDLYDFPVSRQAIEVYLSSYMAWWRGERKARGVEIEEAFKCHSCEFAAECSWRQEMDRDLVHKARQKASGTRASGR